MKKSLADYPQETINRLYKIKMHRKLKKLKPYIQKIFLIKLRIKLTIDNKKNMKYLEKTFKTILIEKERIENSNFTALKEVHNISLYILLAERDLQAIKIDAFTHPNEWKRNLSLRVMLLIINERDISKVITREVKDTIFLYISEDLKTEMVNLLRKIKKNYNKVTYALKDIRNNSIAHRDANAILQYEVINTLNIFDVKDILEEYGDLSNKLLILLTKISYEVGNVMSLLSQQCKLRENSK